MRTVNGKLAIAHFGAAAHEPVDVELLVDDDHNDRPVLEIRFSSETTWRLELTTVGAAYTAGALAKASGVNFSVL